MKILTSYKDSPIADIYTVEDPGTVAHLEDLADFRLVMMNDYGHESIVHFQIDIKIPRAPAPDVAARLAKELWTELQKSITTPEFMMAHGQRMLGKNSKERSAVHTRTISTFERMLRFGIQPSNIRASNIVKGACTFELRMARGISVRCHHLQLKAEIEKDNRPFTGSMFIAGQEYGYTIWQPPGVRVADIPFDVLQKAVVTEIAHAFPFVNLQCFEMIQSRPLDGTLA